MAIEGSGTYREFSFGPFTMSWGKPSAHKITTEIIRQTFTRIKADATTWRDAVKEAESPWYPYRAKMQQLYQDTILNGHVRACMAKRNNLVLLKDYCIMLGDTVDEKSTELIHAKWFEDALSYAQDAKYFGYNLVQFGDIINGRLPDIGIVPRENVSPDRMHVAKFPWTPYGVPFDDPAGQYYDWVAYFPTKTEKGLSPCGYGLLYIVAIYEIYLRSLTAANASYIEKYGHPIRVGKTAKTSGPEYDQFCAALANMGEQAWMAMDLNDEIEFVGISGAGTGQGYKAYENFEQRLHKLISKVLLGHADAMDSTPGKIGGNQDGEESAVAQALEDIESVDTKDLERAVNDIFLPKLMKIGIPIPVGGVFKFKNNKELQETRENEDKINAATADYVLKFKQAGYSIDPEWLSDRTGIPIEADAPEDAEGDAKAIRSTYK